MSETEIVDLSGVSPQQTFLQSRPSERSPQDTLYIDRFTTENVDTTRSHLVIGVNIELRKGAGNGLWDVLHVDRSQKLDPTDPRVATRSLVICCDTLTVHGELSIPEAVVSIYARRLEWATPDAAINTSPLAWAVAKAPDAIDGKPGQNGAHGRHAGSFQVFVAEVSPPADSRPRLVALAGNGQHPGAGKDGVDGYSMSSWSSQPYSTSAFGFVSKANVQFSPPAVYVEAWWWWPAVKGKTMTLGQDRFPDNGTSALAPGIPGDAGNGGGLTTNLAAVVPTFKNSAGEPGTQERNYRGGAAGTPTSSAKYKVELKFNSFGTDDAGKDIDKFASHDTKAGTGADSKAAGRTKGDKPAPKVVEGPRAWVHPLGLQRTLEYAREAFLAGQRVAVEALLSAYEPALSDTMPTDGAWDDGLHAQWNAGQSEVAAMLQRLRGHLDYFGNAAGYTPLLSLAGAIQLYKEETRRALRTLLVVGWIGDQERDATAAANALGEAIVALTADSEQAAEEVVRSEATVTDVSTRIDALEQELKGVGTRLGTLRTQLETKAKNDEQQKAQIKFAIKMAAAVCQVIPVGQPVLGAIGSLGSVAAGFIGGDAETAPDTVSELSEVMKKARTAGKKAEAAAKKAKEKKKDPPKDGETAKKESKAWGTVGDGLAPALSQVSQAMKALQVPASEVEAQLQKLEAQSDEWQALTKTIRDLNERKAAFFADLVDALQSLGEAYARITSNAGGIFTMQRERDKKIGKLNPAATGFVKQVGQRSRLTLLRYLYLMVKSYEATVLSPIDVDWDLTEVTKKLTTLLKPDEGLTAATLNAQVEALEPLFQANLDKVRERLLKEFSVNEITFPLLLGLSHTQTPGALADLHAMGEVVIDPVAHGLVLPTHQLGRISNVVLKALEFDPTGPRLPDTHNMIVSLQPAHTGTIRKGEHLYSVYSDEPLTWTWTYVVSGGIRPGTRSEASKDILDMVLGLGPSAVKIRQKVALPPVWSDLAIRVTYSPALALDERPRITKLYFDVACDFSSAPEHQRVLTVRALGAPSGAVIECSPDLGQRGNGFERMIRIFTKGATVRLAVPNVVGGAAFEDWDVVGTLVNQVGVTQPGVEVKLGDNVLAQCHWRRAHQEIAPVLTSDFTAAELAQIAEGAPKLKLAAAEMAEDVSEPQARDLPIRVEASETATVVGIAPSLDDADLVQEGADGGKQVNYRGVVGWVSA